MKKMRNKRNTSKSKLHPRNKHRDDYDFQVLVQTCPELTPFVKINEYGKESIDFFNPAAVRSLNKSLLLHFYGLTFWEIPPNYLCPPVPGRADYLHHIADHLREKNKGSIPRGNKIRCLDVGVGANCIYPIIGQKEYGWSFIGSDIDSTAIANINKIISENELLKEKIETRLQANPKNIFRGIIQSGEYIDLTICNPPFHSSAAAAKTGTLRKLEHLQKKKVKKTTLNFGGQSNELWCDGGEIAFVKNMILESKEFSTSCYWFSTLISKKENLQKVYVLLEKVEAIEVKTIPMGQGNKLSRIVAWTFLSEKQQGIWKKMRW